MPALHKIKCELQTIRRGYKLLYSIDRDVILYKALRALIAVISPYTALYFTSQLINGIAAKKAFGQLMGYAVFIVGIKIPASIIRLYHIYWIYVQSIFHNNAEKGYCLFDNNPFLLSKS